MSPSRAERAVVWLIALHSYAVGIGLVFFTSWGLRLGGWEGASPLFFPRQAGAFHLVVATGYLMEYLRQRGVSLLLVTKAIAFVFLTAATALGDEPWVVPVSGALDGLMGLTVLVLHRWARRESDERVTGASVESGR
jgi:hypothetical protein